MRAFNVLENPVDRVLQPAVAGELLRTLVMRALAPEFQPDAQGSRPRFR